MSSLKEEFESNIVNDTFGYDDFGAGIVRGYEEAYLALKRKVLDFNMFIKTLKNENSVNGLTDKDREIICLIMDKYKIEAVERDLNTYEHILYIHKKIFGDWENE